jgi:eukaryotic-like serine/threonine-protein kinase
MDTRATVTIVGGRYRLDGLLGEGGMARVYDAFDERLERQVALKILRPQTEALPGMRQRFQLEARIAARLVHPHIVAILDYGEIDASCFLVMERLSGITLRDEIASAPLTRARFLRVMGDTLAALGAAHRCGVLHRDIKPSNILLDDGRAKIADFGIAKSVDGRTTSPAATQDLTMTGIVLGTPGYLAPERRTGHPASVQSDLYSVGAVMVEAVSGRRLEAGADVARLVPPALLPIVARALAPDPRQRFSSAEAMAEALGTLQRRPGPPGSANAVPTRPLTARTVPGTPPVLARQPPVRPVRRHPWWHIALLAAIAVVLTATVAYGLAVGTVQPTAPATSRGAAAPPATSTRTHAKDPERSAIRTVAAQIAQGGMPGDPAMAAALDATAAEPAGTQRQASAEQALSLAQVLVNGNGITADQYQDVVSTLQATGATVPTTTTTTTTVPAPSLFEPFGGHGFHHGHGDGGGDGAQG